MNTTLSVVQNAVGLFTVDNTVVVTMALVGDNQGSHGQLVSVVGTMDQRTLDVEVIGKTPLLLSVLSRDASLAVLSTSPFANAADLTVATSSSLGLFNADIAAPTATTSGTSTSPSPARSTARP